MERNETEIVGKGSIKKMEFFNPFPGLRPFNFDESHLFFGREGQSDEILLNLARSRFAAVIGASGSGKSSLMYCGLIPVLYGGFMTNAGSDWTVLVARPGISPIDNLAEAILLKDKRYSDADKEDKDVNKAITSTILRSSHMGLVDSIKHLADSPDKNIFILIDQFEELFRFIKDNENTDAFNEASFFVNLLIRSVKQKDLPIYVAITMRSDFIGDCSQFPELTHLINRSHYLIPQMTREQKERAIVGPISVGGAKITSRLVQQLLNDVGNNPDQLPILQHALMRTWDHWSLRNKHDDPIDFADYKAVGRIGEALSMHANETYAQFDEEGKRICEILFKALTEKGPDNQGIRRSARLEDIAEIADVEEEKVAEVVEEFKGKGGSLLATPGSEVLTSESIIEITHESLMRIWGRLKNWVDEEAESANNFKRLALAARRHQEGRSGALRDAELTITQDWFDRQKPTEAWARRYSPDYERAIDFLHYSQTKYAEEQELRRRLEKQRFNRTRNIAVILGIAAVVSIFFFIFGWIKKMDADAQREIADTERERAVENQRKAEENARTARLQTAEAERAREEVEQALKQVDSARYVALNNERIAVDQRRRALLNEQRAITEKSKSDSLAIYAQGQADLAFEQKELADRLRMLSIAQSMSVKSLTVKDVDLKVLLAYQAYLYNEKYNGSQYDNYIYDGLYNAKKEKLKAVTGEDFNAFREHKGMIRSITVSKDGQTFFTAGSDGSVIEWDGNNYARKRTIIPENDHINYVVKLSHDERWLTVAGDAPFIRVINLESGRQVKLEGHRGPVTEIIFLPNSDYFLSLGIADSSLRINDYVNTSVFKKFNNRLTALSISPNGEVLVGGNEKGELIVWDTKNMDNAEIYSPGEADDQSPLYALDFSPNGRILAAGSENGEVRLYSVKGSKILDYLPEPLRGQESRINEIKFSGNGELLATASFDGTIQLWVMENMEKMLPIAFKDHNDYVWNIEFSPDSRYLFAGTRNGTLKVWPTKPEYLAQDVCKYLHRNMNQREWQRYVGEDIQYEFTCRQAGVQTDMSGK